MLWTGWQINDCEKSKLSAVVLGNGNVIYREYSGRTGQSKASLSTSHASPWHLIAALGPYVIFRHRWYWYSTSKVLSVPLQRSGASVRLIELARLQSAEGVPRVSMPSFIIQQ